MAKIYCIYSNQEVEEEQSTPEHIIPLSLGGCNEFVLPVENTINSELGYSIDGKLSNDFIITLIRKHHGYQGHSKSVPVVKLKKSKIVKDNIPVQVKFTKLGIEVFNPIEKRLMTEEEIKNVELQSTIQIDRFIRIIFTSKVLLSAGYFTYGETFRTYADHESLRKLMRLNFSETKESIKNLPIQVVDKFHEISKEDKGMAGMFELICKAFNGSCVLFLLCTENIIGTVGIGGEFIGSINFKADTSKFPNDEEFRLGHVLGIQDGQLKRDSFYEATRKLHEIIKKK